MYLYFGYIVPYVILILINVLIVYEATKYERSQRTLQSINKKKTKMIRTILILTTMFIVTSLPSTIVAGYFYFYIIQLDFWMIIINFIDGVQFSFPAFNFFILFLSNKLFAKSSRKFFKILLFHSTPRTNSNKNAKSNSIAN